MYLLKEFVHKAFVHAHSDFILLLCRLLPLRKDKGAHDFRANAKG